MLLATVPAAPPTLKNQRTTSCPAPISANVPYHRGSRLIFRALEWVSIASFTKSEQKCTNSRAAAIATCLLNRGCAPWKIRRKKDREVKSMKEKVGSDPAKMGSKRAYRGNSIP